MTSSTKINEVRMDTDALHSTGRSLAPQWFVSLWAMVGVAAALALSSCAGTEADNPFMDVGNTQNDVSVIDKSKITVEDADIGVRVVGAAGAITSGEADVSVTNVSSGYLSSTTSASDGSFEVEIDGNPDDEFRIDVSDGDASDSVTLGAATSGGDEDPLVEQLTDRSFLLESAEGFSPVPDTTIRINFNEDSGFGFNAGCNSHFGEYSLCDGDFCLDALESTAAGCLGEGLHEQDEFLADFFRSQPAFAVDESRVTFTSEDATLVFLDRELADSDRSLVGQTWTITTFIQGDIASGGAYDSPPTVEFFDDGTFEFFTTCNNGEGEYVESDDELTLSNVSVTEAGCPSELEQGAEEHILDVLGSDTVTWEIDAARLTIMNGDLGIHATTEPADPASDPGTDDLDEQLTGRTFLLESAEGFSPIADSMIRINFDEGNNFGFHAGCNGHGAVYSVCDDALCTEGFSNTDIGCSEEAHEQDYFLASFFGSTPQIELDEPRLTFTSDDAILVFLDRELAEPDEPLVGQTWTIDTFIRDMGATSSAFDQRPTIEFFDDGTFAFFTTCNNGGGEYVESGAALELSNVGVEERGCPSELEQDAEAHILDVLGADTVTWEIEATRLTIINGDLGISATTQPTESGEPAQ